jgi:two-component system invasion response regulator UvrY
MKVLTCDDHIAVTTGIKNMLMQLKEVESVAEAKNSTEVIDLIKHEKFDVVILDLTLNHSEMSGMELLNYIKSKYPDTNVMIYTMHSVHLYALPAFRAGALSYLTKDGRPEELIAAVRSVAKGTQYINSETGSLLLRQANGEADIEPYNNLSNLEFKVLIHTGIGKSVQEIADENNSNYKTVSKALHDMMDKMGFKKKSEITPYCIRHKIFDLFG